MVGPYPIFGLRPAEVMDDELWSVMTVTERFRGMGVAEVSSWYIISEDHSGNPVGVDADGKVWIYDHDFGGVTELAASFEDYIRTQCLELTS